MQEQHRLAMGPDLGCAVTKDPRTFGGQAKRRLGNILDLLTDVVNAARRIFFQKPGNRRVLAQRV